MKSKMKNESYIIEKSIYGKKMESLWKCFGKDAIEIKNAYLSLKVESQDQDLEDGVFNLNLYFMFMDKEKEFWKENCYIRIFEELGLLEVVCMFINDSPEGWIHDYYVADYDYVSLYKLIELTDEIIEEACKRAKDIFCVEYPFQGDQLVVNK